MSSPRLLIVDDESAFCVAISRYLTRGGFSVREAGSLREARAALSGERFHGILLDLHLPDGNGIDMIPDLRSGFPDMAIIVATGSGEIPVAVEAMRRGADHFVTKPVDPQELDIFLRRSLEVAQLRRKSAVQARLYRPAEPFFGSHKRAREAQKLAAIAAASDSAVLLTGETGTGKGVFAKWIHAHSPRRKGEFVEVNCSVLRGELLANELFGHARGAFTSANEARPGLLEAADGGTLFLDEIGDMDPAIQAQFLKVIEEKRYRRLGEITSRASDFRLVCATNHSLADDVASGRFRNDLLFRINVLMITLPPLRATSSDLAPLVRHLLTELGAAGAVLDREAAEALEGYEWPGNVRELRNVLERALLLSCGDEITLECLPGVEPLEVQPHEDAGEVLRTLERCGGDKARAAQELGISRATLYRRLQSLKR